jgi:8-oxo-dGTP pyrophosphatase MutT (NUDIX family)
MVSKKKESIPEYSSVILISTKGEIILQLRDNNPKIVDPNKLSLFAGKLLSNETKEQAALRELFEETTIRLNNSNDLKYLFTYHAKKPKFDRERLSHVFILKHVDEKRIDVQEGQGYRKVKNKIDLKNYDVAQISEEILLSYFER